MAFLVNFFSPVPTNLLPDAINALKNSSSDDPQAKVGKNYQLKTFSNIPTYLLLATSVAGVAVIIAGAVLKNHLALAGGIGITVTSLGGAYYAHCYLKLKPFVYYVEQLTTQVDKMRKVREDLEKTLEGYKKVEADLQQDNEKLRKLISENASIVTTSKKNFETEKSQLDATVQKLEDNTKQLAAYRTLCDQLQKELTGIAQDVADRNQVVAQQQANLGELNKQNNVLKSTEDKLKSDNTKSNADTTQLEQQSQEFAALFKGLKEDIALSQTLYDKVKIERDKQLALLNQVGAQVSSLQAATASEDKTSTDLNGVADQLQAKLQQFESLAKILPLLQQILKEQLNPAKT